MDAFIGVAPLFERVLGSAGVLLVVISGALTWTLIKVHANCKRIEEVAQEMQRLAIRLDQDERTYMPEKTCLTVQDTFKERLERDHEDAKAMHSEVMETLRLIQNKVFNGHKP
jgi:hypothetical protein